MLKPDLFANLWDLVHFIIKRAHEYCKLSAFMVCRLKIWTLFPKRPMSCPILDHVVASVLSGKQIEASVFRAVWTLRLSINPLPFSLSAPLCFSLLTLLRDGGHAWSRAENGQWGSSRIPRAVITAAQPLCRLYTVQPYYLILSVFISFKVMSSIADKLLFPCERFQFKMCWHFNWFLLSHLNWRADKKLISVPLN